MSEMTGAEFLLSMTGMFDSGKLKRYKATINGKKYEVVAPNIIAAWKECRRYQAVVLGHIGPLSVQPEYFRLHYNASAARSMRQKRSPNLD